MSLLFMARNFKEAPLVSTKNSTNSQELGRKLKKIITQVKQNFSDQFKRANIFWDEKVFKIITIFFLAANSKKSAANLFLTLHSAVRYCVAFFFLSVLSAKKKCLCFRSFLSNLPMYFLSMILRNIKVSSDWVDTELQSYFFCFFVHPFLSYCPNIFLEIWKSL